MSLRRFRWWILGQDLQRGVCTAAPVVGDRQPRAMPAVAERLGEDPDSAPIAVFHAFARVQGIVGGLAPGPQHRRGDVPNLGRPPYRRHP